MWSIWPRVGRSRVESSPLGPNCATDPPEKTLWWYAWPRGGGPLQVPNSQWWQLHNFGTSSLSILLFLGGGEGGPRSGNMGAAGFGATVSGAPPPQTIVWWWGAGGTMEGPLEEANLVRADSTRCVSSDRARTRARHLGLSTLFALARDTAVPMLLFSISFIAPRAPITLAATDCRTLHRIFLFLRNAQPV